MCVCACACVFVGNSYVALGTSAVLMEHAATLGGLAASAGHSRGNTEDPVSSSGWIIPPATYAKEGAAEM